MKRLTVSAVLFLLVIGINSFVLAQSPLKGTLGLKIINPQHTHPMTVASEEITTEEWYPACLKQITFEEKKIRMYVALCLYLS